MGECVPNMRYTEPRISQPMGKQLHNKKSAHDNLRCIFNNLFIVSMWIYVEGRHMCVGACRGRRRASYACKVGIIGE